MGHEVRSSFLKTDLMSSQKSRAGVPVPSPKADVRAGETGFCAGFWVTVPLPWSPSCLEVLRIFRVEFT
jgi:hypothetical protein